MKIQIKSTAKYIQCCEPNCIAKFNDDLLSILSSRWYQVDCSDVSNHYACPLHSKKWENYVNRVSSYYDKQNSAFSKESQTWGTEWFINYEKQNKPPTVIEIVNS